jgi:hypothetical protein
LELKDGLPSSLESPVQKIKPSTKERKYSQEGMTRKFYRGIDSILLRSKNKAYDEEKYYDSNGKVSQTARREKA